MLLNCSWLCKGSGLYFILTKSKESKWLISETIIKLYMCWVLFWLTNVNNCSSFRRVSLKTIKKNELDLHIMNILKLKKKTHIIVCNRERKHNSGWISFSLTYNYFKPQFFFQYSVLKDLCIFNKINYKI